MFKLIVEFFPRKDNGDVMWDANPIFWEESFDDLSIAKRAYMEAVPFMHTARNKFTPCNLRGKLLNEDELIWSWDWTWEEKRDEAGRSELISKWLDSLEQQGREGEDVKIEATRIKNGLSIVDLLIELKLCQSKNDARRQLTGGGVKLNNEKVTEPRDITLDDFKDGSCTLSKGKKEKKKISLAKEGE